MATPGNPWARVAPFLWHGRRDLFGLGLASLDPSHTAMLTAITRMAGSGELVLELAGLLATATVYAAAWDRPPPSLARTASAPRTRSERRKRAGPIH